MTQDCTYQIEATALPRGFDKRLRRMSTLVFMSL